VKFACQCVDTVIGCRRPPCADHGLLRDQRTLGDIEVDLFCHSALLGCRVADLCVHYGDMTDRRCDRVESVAGGVDQRLAGFCTLATAVHDINCLVGALLQALDHRPNPGRRALCTAARRPHLVGNDGEAAALFTRPRGLDRGVQCEQVRVFGDAPEGVQDLADRI